MSDVHDDGMVEPLEWAAGQTQPVRHNDVTNKKETCRAPQQDTTSNNMISGANNHKDDNHNDATMQEETMTIMESNSSSDNEDDDPMMLPSAPQRKTRSTQPKLNPDFVWDDHAISSCFQLSVQTHDSHEMKEWTATTKESEISCNEKEKPKQQPQASWKPRDLELPTWAVDPLLPKVTQSAQTSSSTNHYKAS